MRREVADGGYWNIRELGFYWKLLPSHLASMGFRGVDIIGYSYLIKHGGINISSVVPTSQCISLGPNEQSKQGIWDLRK